MKRIFRFLGAVVIAVSAAGAHAQMYPGKPITIVVPFSPGGVTDVMARQVATKLGEELAVPVIVVNKAGAGTLIASQFVARTPGDGYTVLMAASSFGIGPSLYGAKAGYDPEKQFKGVTLLATVPHILVVPPQMRAGDVAVLIRELKSGDMKNANYASSGVGTSNHLEGELFNAISGLNLTHIPFQGSVPALTAIAGGEIGMMFVDVAAAKPFLDSGKVRPLAVTTQKRSALLPNLPTVDEAGLKGFDATPWLGFVVPASTPDSVVATLNEALQKMKDDAGLKDRLASMGLEANFGGAAEFVRFMAQDRRKWEEVIRRARITAE